MDEQELVEYIEKTLKEYGSAWVVVNNIDPANSDTIWDMVIDLCKKGILEERQGFVKIKA